MNQSSSSTSLGMILSRSLFPFTTILIVAGAIWWGPWASLGLAYVWWRFIGRVA